jgi:hypothetical protein
MRDNMMKFKNTPTSNAGISFVNGSIGRELLCWAVIPQDHLDHSPSGLTALRDSCTILQADAVNLGSHGAGRGKSQHILGAASRGSRCSAIA